MVVYLSQIYFVFIAIDVYILYCTLYIVLHFIYCTVLYIFWWTEIISRYQYLYFAKQNNVFKNVKCAEYKQISNVIYHIQIKWDQ